MTIIQVTNAQLHESVLRVLKERVDLLDQWAKSTNRYNNQISPTFTYLEFVGLVEKDVKKQVGNQAQSASGHTLVIPADATLSSKDKSLVRWVIWELIITGMLVPGRAEGDDANNLNLPFFTLTQQGLDTLSGGDSAPLDPLGFTNSIKSLVNLNDQVKLYSEEAVKAFHRGLLISTLESVGAASELLFTQLFVTVQNNMNDAAEKAKLDRDQHAFISKRMTTLKAVLEVKKAQIPGDIYEKSYNNIPKMVDAVRITRNDVLHPIKPATYDRGFVLAQLALLLSAARHIDESIKHFNTVPLK